MQEAALALAAAASETGPRGPGVEEALHLLYPRPLSISSIAELSEATYDGFKSWLTTVVEPRLCAKVFPTLDAMNALPATRQVLPAHVARALREWHAAGRKDGEAAAALEHKLGDVLGLANDASLNVGVWYITSALQELAEE